MFVVYVGSHEALEKEDKKQKMVIAIPFAVLHWLKLMGGNENYNRQIADKFRKQDQFQFFNIENSYRIQIIVETAL